MCPDVDVPKIDIFKKLYPAFVDVHVDIINFWLSDAKTTLCHKSLCHSWEKAVYLYIAHWLSINNMGSSSQPATAGQNIKQHTVYDATVIFDNTNSADKTGGKNPYQGSIFGAKLYALLRLNSPRILNTGMIPLC